MASPDQRTQWFLVLLLWGAGLGAAAQYAKISVVFEALGTLYPEAGTVLAWAVSLVGVVGILLGVAAAAVVGRVGLRRAMLAGLWLGAAMSLFQGVAPPFWLFLSSRVIEGAAHLLLVVAAPTLIAGVSTARDQGLSLTLWGTFFGVAFALLAWFGVPLAERFGAQALFLAHGIYLALCALVLARFLPHGGPASRDEALTPAALFARHRRIYRSAWLGAPAAGWLFYTFCFVSLMTLLPPYLAPDQRGFVMAAIPLVSIASSMTVGVWLMRRLCPIRVVQLGFLGSAVMALALGVWQGQPALCLGLAFCLGLNQGASFAAVPVLAKTPQDRALANGGLAQTGNIGNTLGTPVLYFVVTTMGYTAMLWALALALLSGFAIHLFLETRRRRAA